MDIVRAITSRDMAVVRKLFREYEAFLNVDLCFQQFESELAGLPGKYAPPSGTLLLALDGTRACGCGALRRFGVERDRMCEMKRLYVRPGDRGKGIGKRMADRLIRDGVRLGYDTMVLDTLDRLDAAVGLYESLGFIRIPPYYENPLPGAVYWRLDLRGLGG